MKNIMGALIGAFLLLAPTWAAAVVHIKDDPGGVIQTFILKYQAIRAANDTVVIDGDCVSACTLALTILRPENVCMTDKARFGFHSAYYRDPSNPFKMEFAKEATEEIYNAYPAVVRAALKQRGWVGQEHPELIYLTRDDIGGLIAKCDVDADGVPFVPRPTTMTQLILRFFKLA